jgi:hypothetical protein
MHMKVYILPAMWKDGDDVSQGITRSIYYFDFCGEENTEKVLELSKERAKECGIHRIIIASETGLSALKAISILEGLDIIVVTSASGSKVKNTGMGDMRLGISDQDIERKIKEHCTLVRGTDPFHNIWAPFNTVTPENLIRYIMYCMSSGIGVCMLSTLMATDHGVIQKGERVVACAGSFVGLDTSCVVRASNSVDLFEDDGLVVEEIICKPRNPKYEWPIQFNKWKGDLEQYRQFHESH